MHTPPWQQLLIKPQFLKPWTAQARDECFPAYVRNITLHIHNLTLCRGSSNLISLPSEENVSALLLCSIFFLPPPPLLFAYKQLGACGFVAWLLQGS